MQFPLQKYIGFLALTHSSRSASANSCAPFPCNLVPFSSSFSQPAPPAVNTEFRASWIQHKWNINVSHIGAGFLYTSPTAGKVRVDVSYDMNTASSLFDYSNISSEGLVSNILYTFSPSIASPPTIFEGYVNPNFPLFTVDILSSNSAVFTGLVKRDKNGVVASWSIMYQSAIPVTIFVNECDTIVGYDYFSPGLRTRVITEFFNIILGPIPDDIFKLPSRLVSGAELRGKASG